jgi:large subunit ribosomal protein L28
MSKVCDVCKKGPKVARRIIRHGKPKKEGGIGLHTTGINHRRQMANLRPLKAVVDGKPVRLLVCSRCLRSGKVTKRMAVKKTVPAKVAPVKTAE